ncbi:PREDICTED: uncharacterized protein LOC106818437 [Priapulus caudatus]|uniref:Uncharacterized protein LOC106818437 n=1 Tax=Priapulus caudatus TaxID=37621 RepID=A0ABM1F2G3_PRICU|nr:PREDICTED: uncharacterized protein LOC106818437 [Priapulus caudatus]XP_014678634.1 PREDICTED: uncharacterized protein LOC106818437 [Priapulus caudatus]
MRIKACSVLVKDGSVFLSGLVGAAMKKKVSYAYKLRLCKETGEFLNSHCECPAGKGPNATCKHVAAVMLMLAKFVSSDCDPLIRKTCTENLQSFHRPKSVYSVSPVKAVDLPVQKKRKIDMEDPIPAKYRKCSGYEDRVRSVVLNYCSMSSQDLVIKYKYEKADIYTAAKDHHYMKKPLLECWVENASKLDDSQAKMLEKNTRKQADSSLWFQERRLRITASRFGEVVSLTKRRNIEKLCKSLNSNVQLHTAAISHGKTFESKAITAFEQKFSMKVQACGLHVRPDLYYLRASPDGLIGDNALLEVKCPYRGRDKLVASDLSFKFLCEKDGKIQLKRTHNYFDQIQGQLHVCKRSLCYFVVYTHKDLYVEEISYDRKYCELSLIPKLEIFYQKYYLDYLARHSF